jgi:outer membrane protein assembly factor BamB
MRIPWTTKRIDRARNRPTAVRLAAALVMAAAAATAVAPGLATAASDPTGGWPQFGQNAAHLGVSPAADPAPPYKVRWTFHTPTRDGALSAPVTDGDLAVALGPHYVYGVDVATSELRWRVPRNGGSTLASPAIAEVDGTPILLFTQGGSARMSRLVAFSLKDPNAPSLLWQEPLDDRATTGVAVDDDTAYTVDVGGEVVAVRIATDTLGIDVKQDQVLWRRVVPGLVPTPPTVAGGMVIVVARNRTTGHVEVDAIGGAKHQIVWTKTDTAASSASSVTVDGSRVIVGFGETTGAGVLDALNLKDGLQEWSTRFSSPFLPFTNIPVTDGFALPLGNRLGLEAGLYHVDAATGEKVDAWNYGTNGLWSYEFDISGVFASPMVVGNTVVLGFDDGRMAAVELNTGVLVWKSDTGTRPIRGLAVADGAILATISSRSGSMMAFEHDPDGALLSEVSPSKPDWTTMLTNYLIAFAAVGLVAAGLGLLAARRRRSAPADAGDDFPAGLPPEGEPA